MSDKSEGEEFAGFPPPTKNFFSLPNEMINIIAHITNMAELKIIIYVIRHTWGFHEYGIKKVITTDEFMHGRKRNDDTRMDEGTGLSNRSVIDGLRAAVEHGYLEYELDETDKARKVKSYALKMQASQIDEMDVKNVHIEHNNRCEDTSYQGEVSSHQREDTSHRTEKDTIEKHLKKESVSAIPTSTTPPRDTHTFEHSSLEEEQGGSHGLARPLPGSRVTSAAALPGDTGNEIPPSPEAIAAEPPAQQTHSAGTAMSTTAPRTPSSPSVSPSGVRGAPLQDHNRVGSPPADDKSHTNKPELSKQELALRKKWAKYVSEDIPKETVIIALQLRSRWLEAYGAYGDAEWDNQAILWLAQQDNGTWENIQKVVEHWAKVKPGENIHPEMVKNKWFWLSEKSKANTPAALLPPRVKTREELRKEAY